MMNRLLLPVGLILITFCCCPFAPIAQYLVTKEPKVEDIIGFYELKMENVVKANVPDTIEPGIEMIADGTCKLADFPVLIENDADNFSYEFKELFTNNCQWNVITNGSVERNGKLLPVWAVCFSAVDFEPAIKCANLTDDGNPYNLVFVFGDPDSNEIMVFERLPSQ